MSQSWAGGKLLVAHTGTHGTLSKFRQSVVTEIAWLEMGAEETAWEKVTRKQSHSPVVLGSGSEVTAWRGVIEEAVLKADATRFSR